MAFDDSGWASGAAPLGYGDPMTTTVNCGPNAPTCTSSNYITTYFPHAFTVADPSLYTNLVIDLLRDDGAVVYLNGQEVLRNNMPAGAITSLTCASANLSGQVTPYIGAQVAPTNLMLGVNVLAVEIHQSSKTSGDISFDLQLTGVREPLVITMDSTNDASSAILSLSVTNTTISKVTEKSVGVGPESKGYSSMNASASCMSPMRLSIPARVQ